MEIVFTEEEVKNFPVAYMEEIENNEFDKCSYCNEFGAFLKHTFFVTDTEKINNCEDCDKNFEVKFYMKKELSKKEYCHRFIEQPLTDDIRNSKVKIMDCGVVFIDETNFPVERKFFIKQAINPDVMFEGEFKRFNFGGQLDKILDLTETAKDEKHNIYILKAYYRVFKTLVNPNHFSI